MKKKRLWMVSTICLSVFLVVFVREKKKDELPILALGDTGVCKYHIVDSNMKMNKGDIWKMNLVTYDKKSKNKIEKNIKLRKKDFPKCSHGIESFDTMPLILTKDERRLLGIDIKNGDVKEILANFADGTYAIRNFSIHNDNLIYSYVKDGKTIVDFKSVDNENINRILEVQGEYDIPMTINESVAAFILKDKINIYDIKEKKIVYKSNARYLEDILLHGNKLYTYRKSDLGYDFIELGEGMKETTIMKNSLWTSRVYYYDNMIAFGEYFYDIESKKVYVRDSDYIGEKYLIPNINKNCYYYPLKKDSKCGKWAGVYDDNTVLVLDESIIIKDENNNIIEKIEGFDDIKHNYVCHKSKIYAIEKKKDKLILVSINLKNGKKKIIKDLKDECEFWEEVKFMED